jgi:protein TonB
VTVEGKVIDARVVESEPRRTFDSAARDAVRRWRFEPATQGGAPIASTSRVRLEFRLKD